jgi:hypothetical protein
MVATVFEVITRAALIEGECDVEELGVIRRLKHRAFLSRSEGAVVSPLDDGLSSSRGVAGLVPGKLLFVKMECSTSMVTVKFSTAAPGLWGSAR